MNFFSLPCFPPFVLRPFPSTVSHAYNDTRRHRRKRLRPFYGNFKQNSTKKCPILLRGVSRLLEELAIGPVMFVPVKRIISYQSLLNV